MMWFWRDDYEVHAFVHVMLMLVKIGVGKFAKSLLLF